MPTVCRKNPRFLICDRDRKWSAAVRRVFESAGVRVVRIPFRAERLGGRSGDTTGRSCPAKKSTGRNTNVSPGKPRVFRHIARWGSMKRRCRSRQLNTHKTESRDVCYPWHPWFGRTLAVHEVFVKYGQSICHCGLEVDRTRGIVEIPTWMCEPATCGRPRVMPTPTVSCDVLVELQALLRTVRHPDCGQARLSATVVTVSALNARAHNTGGTQGRRACIPRKLGVGFGLSG
jgi:hypothetical protein